MQTRSIFLTKRSSFDGLPQKKIKISTGIGRYQTVVFQQEPIFNHCVEQKICQTRNQWLNPSNKSKFSQKKIFKATLGLAIALS